MTKLSSTPAGAVLVEIDMAENRQGVLIDRPRGRTAPAHEGARNEGGL